jgi:hypothetical protein
MPWLNLAEALELHSSLIQQSSRKELGCCLTIESRAFHQVNGANGLHFLMVTPDRRITSMKSRNVSFKFPPWLLTH